MNHSLRPEEYRFCPRCAGEMERRQVQEGEPTRLVCPLCHLVFYLDPKVAACTVFQHEGGIVLGRRAIDPGKGRWVFPGGFVDRGEAASEAAVREAREEVGLRVSLLGILDVYSYAGEDVVVVVYCADVLGGERKPSREFSEVRSFPPEALPWEDLAFASTRSALRDYVRRYFPRVRVPR